METEEAKTLYRARASLCELMNAHLRTSHGVDEFLVSGLAKVTCVVARATHVSGKRSLEPWGVPRRHYPYDTPVIWATTRWGHVALPSQPASAIAAPHRRRAVLLLSAGQPDSSTALDPGPGAGFPLTRQITSGIRASHMFVRSSSSSASPCGPVRAADGDVRTSRADH